nr:alpha/beta fold hydrolase [Mycoplasmopsis cynos]
MLWNTWESYWSSCFHCPRGPGGGSSFKLKELFNLTKFKLIFFDQRGCGKSQPFLELKDNNTNELVEDIEKLRKYLNLGQINLFGGSWGTTLSLMYAIKYPKNVAKILLRAVFSKTRRR